MVNEQGEVGFTLVELLIAMALLGMLTVLAYGAVQFGNLSWRHVEARRDADADRAAVRRVLGRAIETAYPEFASPNYADRQIAFDGEPTSLQLIAPLPEALSPGLMAVEKFGLGNGSDSMLLLMTWRLDLPAATGGPLPSKITPVARSIASIHLTYFGRSKDGDPPAWFDQWSGMDHLPDLVHVRVWRQGRPNVPWLEFSVAPGTTTNVACVYDLESPTCRRLE